MKYTANGVTARADIATQVDLAARVPQAAQAAQIPELRRDEQGLALVSGKTVVLADFTRLLPRLKPANLGKELLVRAAKLPHDCPTRLAVDATAGLGEDSLLLAAAGFHVQLYERNPVIASLLRDGLERAAATPELAIVVARMQLIEGDSVQALRNLPEQPDVVLLDPMFPEKHSHAAAKKKLQLLQQLESPCDDETALLEAALAACPRKVVIKRPAKGPYLAGRKPSYTISGKAIRYDCIALAR